MNFGCVARLVVGDLKAEKCVDGLDGFRVGGGDLDFGATGSVAVKVTDMAAEFGHRGCARRCCVVDEHGDVEVACRETVGEVRKVHADLFAGGGVFGIVSGNVDGAAEFVEAEMVSGGFVGETHGVVATGGHGIVVGGVPRWRWRWRLLGG
jgi:hypothetical protein